MYNLKKHFNVIILIAMLLCILVSNFLFAADDWSQKSPASKPSARYHHGLTYISDNQVLLFGGYDTSNEDNDDETWIYDLANNTWTQKNPSSKPSQRSLVQISYIGSDQVLLFGGGNNSGRLDDTWMYDLSANTWTQQNPSTKPSARWYHSLAYIGNDQVLLFGGRDNTAFNDETWIYDLSVNTWTLKSPSSKPSARQRHSMSYIGGDQVILYGGTDGDGIKDDTWLYDLSDNTWTQQNPLSKPSARQQHEIAYMGDDKVLLFGGNAQTVDDETWIYDLSANEWKPDINTTKPFAREAHGLATTSLDGSTYLVLFGGYDFSSGSGDDETWTFGGGDYALPVELAAFTVTSFNNKILLEWSTKTETNNYGFQIERRVDNNNWNSIGFEKGKGTTAENQSYSFSDDLADVNHNYSVLYYRLKQIDTDGSFIYSSEILIEKNLPEKFQLSQNYPNPFNPTTTIRYQLADPGNVQLCIFNLAGEKVTTLVTEHQPAGSYQLKWDALDLASGVYIYQLQAEGFTASQKLLLLK